VSAPWDRTAGTGASRSRRPGGTGWRETAGLPLMRPPHTSHRDGWSRREQRRRPDGAIAFGAPRFPDRTSAWATIQHSADAGAGLRFATIASPVRSGPPPTPNTMEARQLSVPLLQTDGLVALADRSQDARQSSPRPHTEWPSERMAARARVSHGNPHRTSKPGLLAPDLASCASLGADRSPALLRCWRVSADRANSSASRGLRLLPLDGAACMQRRCGASRGRAAHFVKLVLTDDDVKATLTAWMNRDIRRNSTGR
jgi:hypothetical protein